MRRHPTADSDLDNSGLPLHVRTPTLIVHSEEDTRVTIGQGDEWFTSLKKQGVPVELHPLPALNARVVAQEIGVRPQTAQEFGV